MDLEFDGASYAGTAGVSSAGGFNQLLLLRLNIHNVSTGVIGNLSLIDWLINNGHPGHAIFDEWAIVDSTIVSTANAATDYNANWRIYLSGKHIAILGNELDNVETGGSHVIRNPWLYKSVISNNNISRGGPSGAAIKMHSMVWTQDSVVNPGGLGTYTEKNIVSDNKIIGSVAGWTVNFTPQDNVLDERLRDIIVERNWAVANINTQTFFRNSAVDATYRNNICDMSAALYHTCINVVRYGNEPPPSDVRIYNNTFYSASTGDFYGVNIHPLATNVTVENNLGSDPLASSPVMISGTGASGFLQSNNLLNNNPSALFVSATPAVPADFMLKALPNPARDTGLSSAPVFSDFFRNSRSQNGVMDIGAVESP